MADIKIKVSIMGYYWFGIQNSDRGAAARQHVKSVFTDINNGIHGDFPEEKGESWSKSHAHLIDREATQASLTSKIHLAVIMLTMLGLIITLV